MLLGLKPAGGRYVFLSGVLHGAVMLTFGVLCLQNSQLQDFSSHSDDSMQQAEEVEFRIAKVSYHGYTRGDLGYHGYRCHRCYLGYRGQ